MVERYAGQTRAKIREEMLGKVVEIEGEAYLPACAVELIHDAWCSCHWGRCGESHKESL